MWFLMVSQLITLLSNPVSIKVLSLPLLFLIHIKYLERNIKYNVIFFADDTMLYSIVNYPVISANDLNHDLKVINQWAYQWKMEFNLIQISKLQNYYFPGNIVQPMHLFSSMVVLW